MPRSGGSRKMATDPASNSIASTTHVGTDRRSKISSSGQANTSFSAPMQAMLFSSGGERNTARTARMASSAVSSETKGSTSRQSLSDRLTPLLMQRGLVAGTTPSLIREMCGAAIQDFAFLPLDGGASESRPKDSSSWKEEGGGDD